MEVVLLICGLLCGYLIYSQGVRDGMKAKEGIAPVVPNPVAYVQKVKEEKEIKEEDKEAERSLHNMFSFNGEEQKVGEWFGQE